MLVYESLSKDSRYCQSFKANSITLWYNWFVSGLKFLSSAFLFEVCFYYSFLLIFKLSDCNNGNPTMESGWTTGEGIVRAKQSRWIFIEGLGKGKDDRFKDIYCRGAKLYELSCICSQPDLSIDSRDLPCFNLILSAIFCFSWCGTFLCLLSFLIRSPATMNSNIIFIPICPKRITGGMAKDEERKRKYLCARCLPRISISTLRIET